MPTMANSEVTDGPVLSFINKRLRALRKKLNRIVQLEDSIAQGKPINKEQEDLIVSKPSVTASIDELEKLRHPLSAAIAEEINLAVQRHHTTPSDDTEKDRNVAEVESKAVEDLLNLLYFGSMFDVKSQNDFTSTMLTRTHERGCCLTYDYVTDDDAADLLGERDLDLISMLGGLLISRPVDSSLSHMNALRRCIEHAKQWLSNSDHPIDSDPNVTYAGLRAKLNKIMASDYFTTTPEMKATVEMAAAAAGNYASFQVPVHGSMVPVQVEGSDEQYQQRNLTLLSLLSLLCFSILLSTLLYDLFLNTFSFDSSFRSATVADLRAARIRDPACLSVQENMCPELYLLTWNQLLLTKSGQGLTNFFQTVAFNLPNDERIVKDRGTSMVMLKNVSEAKYNSFL
ncbi:hypothetical protein TEA_008249 [Camellia sinensis var. sinensis]|uniref:Uncharacterized protein n=1 Tax=Camellia sinensis var. sinensis TaxID=542762 RepID=A0A4S4DG02_CAMSN|nr:hypothetical protein TEA_008249 [Camellia sinensis var. sinensis]